LKRFFNILLFFISILTTATIQVYGQNLPMVCEGSISKYSVKGFNGFSDFFWKISYQDESNNTVVLPATNYTVFGRGDSIEILWDTTYLGGIYTFEVTEVSDYGCTGDPYTQDVMLNTHKINIPFDGVPSSIAACEGSINTLDPGLFKYYLWLIDSTTTPTYLTTTAGTYQVRLVDDNSLSCSYNNIEAIFSAPPEVWLGNDTVLFGNQSLVLDASGPDIVSYKWSDNSTLPSFTVNGQDGKQTISVTVTDLNGCENSDEINITAADYNHLRIPAAFTPNGDGVNDKWYFPAPPKDTQYNLYPYFDNVQVSVFNRWGKLVWDANGSFTAWDGRDKNGNQLPMDSYHYIIRFKVDGKTYLYKGSITIVR
jgi:gliding motility-associated-like protein